MKNEFDYSQYLDEDDLNNNQYKQTLFNNFDHIKNTISGSANEIKNGIANSADWLQKYAKDNAAKSPIGGPDSIHNKRLIDINNSINNAIGNLKTGINDKVTKMNDIVNSSNAYTKNASDGIKKSIIDMKNSWDNRSIAQPSQSFIDDRQSIRDQMAGSINNVKSGISNTVNDVKSGALNTASFLKKTSDDNKKLFDEKYKTNFTSNNSKSASAIPPVAPTPSANINDTNALNSAYNKMNAGKNDINVNFDKPDNTGNTPDMQSNPDDIGSANVNNYGKTHVSFNTQSDPDDISALNNTYSKMTAGNNDMGVNFNTRSNPVDRVVADKGFMQSPMVQHFLNKFDGAKDAISANPGMAAAGALATIIGGYGIYKLIQMYRTWKKSNNVNTARVVAQEACNTYDIIRDITLKSNKCSGIQHAANIKRINMIVQESINFGLPEDDMWNNVKNYGSRCASIGGGIGGLTACSFGGQDVAASLGLSDGLSLGILSGLAGAITGMTVGTAYGIVKTLKDRSNAVEEPVTEWSFPKLSVGTSDDASASTPDINVTPEDVAVVKTETGKALGGLAKAGEDIAEASKKEFYGSGSFWDATYKIKWLQYHPGVVAAVGIPLVVIAAALIKVAYDKWKNNKTD